MDAMVTGFLFPSTAQRWRETSRRRVTTRRPRRRCLHARHVAEADCVRTPRLFIYLFIARRRDLGRLESTLLCCWTSVFWLSCNLSPCVTLHLMPWRRDWRLFLVPRIVRTTGSSLPPHPTPKKKKKRKKPRSRQLQELGSGCCQSRGTDAAFKVREKSLSAPNLMS